MGPMEAAVKNSTIVLAMLLALISGCAARTESFSFSASAQAYCERDRGTWHAHLGVCEVCP